MPDLPTSTHTRRQLLKITAVAGLSLAFGGSVAVGLLRLAGLRRVSSTRTQMGTRVTVTVIHPDAAAARSLVATAFDEIGRLEGILSRHQRETAVDRLNREGILHDSPPELLQLLNESRRYSELTDGAFDSTIAPLLQLYEATGAHSGRVPERSEVEEALSLVGYRELYIDGSVVAFGKPGMAVTLDGIAKGYIVDRTVERAGERGSRSGHGRSGGRCGLGGWSHRIRRLASCPAGSP